MLKGDLKSRVMRPLYTRAETRSSVLFPLLLERRTRRKRSSGGGRSRRGSVVLGSLLPRTRGISVIYQIRSGFAGERHFRHFNVLACPKSESEQAIRDSDKSDRYVQVPFPIFLIGFMG